MLFGGHNVAPSKHSTAKNTVEKSQGRRGYCYGQLQAIKHYKLVHGILGIMGNQGTQKEIESAQTKIQYLQTLGCKLRLSFKSFLSDSMNEKRRE
jgi:hypothetical protein